MADLQEVLTALESIREKINNDEKIGKKFRKWEGKTMEFKLSDLDTSVVITFGPAMVESIEESTPLEKPTILITADGETISKVFTGEISGMKAYTAGKIKVKGAMTDLLKLQKLM